MATLETENIPKREDVLRNLNQICRQLESWAKSSKVVHPIRVKLLRASIYGYSVLLAGLKDEELEIRVMELEQKLKGAVIIPDGSEQQKIKRA